MDTFKSTPSGSILATLSLTNVDAKFASGNRGLSSTANVTLGELDPAWTDPAGCECDWLEKAVRFELLGSDLPVTRLDVPTVARSTDDLGMCTLAGLLVATCTPSLQERAAAWRSGFMVEPLRLPANARIAGLALLAGRKGLLRVAVTLVLSSAACL
jgi:hypothetical protein